MRYRGMMPADFRDVDLLDHILEELGDVRTRCPQLRFGQLIATIGELAADETGHSLWDMPSP